MLQIYVVIVDLSSIMRNQLKTIMPSSLSVKQIVMILYLFQWDILHLATR